MKNKIINNQYKDDRMRNQTNRYHSIDAHIKLTKRIDGIPYKIGVAFWAYKG